MTFTKLKFFDRNEQVFYSGSNDPQYFVVNNILTIRERILSGCWLWAIVEKLPAN